MPNRFLCTDGFEPPKDVIKICDLLLIVSLEDGARWIESDAAVEQPISVSISIVYDVSTAARTDNLSLSIDYFKITTGIRNSTEKKTFPRLRDVSRHISDALADTLADVLSGLRVLIKVLQFRSPLIAGYVSIEHVANFRSDRSWVPSRIAHLVDNLSCDAIIGVDQERAEKQRIVVNLCIESSDHGFDGEAINIRLIMKTLYDEITSSSYRTLEALTSFVASKTLTLLPVYDTPPTVVVRLAKPSALAFACAPEIEMRRSIKDFPMLNTKPHTARAQFGSQFHIVAIALGSNLGDKFRNIEYALQLLENPLQLKLRDGQVPSDAFVHVVDTSFLYESKPMYIEDQPQFINGACIVETNLLPEVLLQLIKAVELEVGRVRTIRFGPRAIDLDIIFYDNDILDTRENATGLDNLEGELVVPHPRLQEREFVLRPLNEMIPDYVHPVFQKTVETLFEEVCRQEGDPMKKIFFFPQVVPSADTAHETQCSWTYSSNDLPHDEQSTTQVMACVNATPDSFSDGGLHDKLPAALSFISSSISAGATIIDIGGYSTRPGATFVSVEEEVNRVVPIIRAMRNREFLEGMKHELETESNEVLQKHIETILKTPISIDTFRWQVAEAAIEAGANCINDVCAFGGPDSWNHPEGNEYTINMKAIARKYSVPVILMHSRGDAGSNKDYTTFNYAADEKDRGSVLEGVRVELGARVDLVTKGKGGVRKWLVIVDPGIGFSKSVEGNLELLRSAKEVVGHKMIGNPPLTRNPLRGLPFLIGASRKSFLGEILAQEPVGRKTAAKERVYATAATVSCAVQQKAMIVRVHDIQEMMDVVKVSEALYL